MSRGKYAKKTQLSVGNIIYWMVGVLLILTMLTIWLVSGLFAKYVISDNRGDSAHVASTGIKKLELLEHKANEFPEEDSGEYRLDLDTEVTRNAYEKVLPGVDIPKDPFIRLELDKAEVDYELYIKVTESNPFPENVKYELTNKWELVDSDNCIYKYKDVFEAGNSYTHTDRRNVIWILKSNRLYVSEHYVGNGQKFTLTFEAWLKQVD